MVYIYDIVLNFNKEILEFFEWEENDNIKYIKRIPLIRANNQFMKDLIKNKIELSQYIIDKIKDKIEYYDVKDNKNQVVIFSDLNIAIAIIIENKIPILYSRLLLEEEYEVISVANKLSELKIDYKVLGPKEKISNLTREERKIQEVLTKEINELYKKNKLEKLNYYYYEYFNKINNKKEEVYKELINSLNAINDKHLKLLEIIKLTSK